MTRPRSLVAMILALTLAACAAPRLHNTTMLMDADIVAMTDAMVPSIADAQLIRGRTPDDPPLVITMDRVENRTEHIMSPGSRWGVMNRLRALLMQTDLRDRRSLIFVLPRQAWRHIESVPAPDAPTPPTHALRATFLSDTQSSLSARTDAYLCAFQLVDLNTGVIEWEDAYEVKFAVRRNEFD